MKNKKPFYKNWWVWVIAVILLLGVVGAIFGEEEAANEPEGDSEVMNNDPVVNETDWDDQKNKENIVGKSDKDFSDLSRKKAREVRNDSTGKWRISTLADNVNIEDYALSYAEQHMKDDEVHYIVNFNNNTTTLINRQLGLLFVDVHEYVDKEEHDANKLGDGMVLARYIIYPDGDVEKLKE